MRRAVPFVFASVGTAGLLGCGPKSASTEGTKATRPPVASRAAPIRLPPIHTSTLPNGLEVTVVEDHELPIARVTLDFRGAGSETIPHGLAGVRAMTVALLREGTTTRSGEEIALAIDGVGGSLGTSTGTDSATLEAAVLSRDLPLALDLVADCAMHPIFPDTEIEEQRAALVASAKSALDDPEAIANAHQERLSWGAGHPYAARTTEASARRITREDVLRYHDTWLTPAGSTLVITGDVPSTIADDVTRRFGAWKGPSPAALPVTIPRVPKQVRIVDEPELTQSFVQLVLPGIARKDRDWYALRVVDTILGAGFSSRLTRRVRTEGGKTYGIDGRFVAMKSGGHYELSTSTRTAETAATLSLVLEELAKIADGTEPIKPVELEHAQAYLAGSYPRSFETAADVTSHLLFAREYGLSLDEVTDFGRRISAVTLDEANAAARAHLNPRRTDGGPLIVVVGNASAIREPIEKLVGPAEVVAPRIEDEETK